MRVISISLYFEKRKAVKSTKDSFYISNNSPQDPSVKTGSGSILAPSLFSLISDPPTAVAAQGHDVLHGDSFQEVDIWLTASLFYPFTSRLQLPYTGQWS